MSIARACGRAARWRADRAACPAPPPGLRPPAGPHGADAQAACDGPGAVCALRMAPLARGGIPHERYSGVRTCPPLRHPIGRGLGPSLVARPMHAGPGTTPARPSPHRRSPNRPGGERVPSPSSSLPQERAGPP